LLNAKFAIVTGASRVVAFETAKEVAPSSAVVMVCSKSTATAKSASVISRGALLKRLRVTDVHGLSEFVPNLAENLEQSDISISTANYPFNHMIWNEMFLEGLVGDFDNPIEVNLNGALMLSHSVVCYVIGDGNIWGVIAIIALTPAIAGETMGAPYSMKKSVIIVISKYIALDYDNRNVWAYTFGVVNISTVVTFSYMTLAERKKGAIENSIKRRRHQTEFATIALSMTSEDFSFGRGKSIIIGCGTVVL
jgi:NAD(P)-dependent dehydrogenase (short-subunit alcohol dehydrogenase family)